MRYKVTKHHFRGKKKDVTEDYYLKFPSLKFAEKWQEKTNENTKLPFVILLVQPCLMYDRPIKNLS